MKKFLISIDTEGDNLWAWHIGDDITTENAKFLPRFQSLCEDFGFVPTYLTNHEMASDDYFVNYFSSKQNDGLCEIGMHLHAWNNPPYFDLPVRTDCTPGAPYLIEYPLDIMEQKICEITDLISRRFENEPISHRAGRWATDSNYFSLLDKYGYLCDCSVTPFVDWSKAAGQSPESKGSDYSSADNKPHIIAGTNLIEVPLTVIENHRLHLGKDAGIRKTVKKHIEAKKGYGPLMLRPRSNSGNLEDLLWLVEKEKQSNNDYIMFMIHSSELMPGGSPTFRTEEDIENLYKNLKILFNEISKSFEGISIGEYAKLIK